MARFVDLELEDEEPPDDRRVSQPRTRNAVTEAFQCYPIVLAIASSLDLTSLDALSRTSFLIHTGLLQHRPILLTSTLHCANDDQPIARDATFRSRAQATNWYFTHNKPGTSTAKAGSCARDLVSSCRRCSRVVCRNCAIKAPATPALRERHRRLCTACTRAPLPVVANRPSFDVTSGAVKQELCACPSGVWLCQPCGRTIRSADHEYRRLWRWRSHYGEALGGLGTGIGDGDRGVICGREARCLGAKEVETEVDCDAAEGRWPLPEHLSYLTAGRLAEAERFSDRTPSPRLGPGYDRHEVLGIGGVVKKTLVRMVSVGACVPVWEEDRGEGVLCREVDGLSRSWCGWCGRVVPGERDREDMAGCPSGNTSAVTNPLASPLVIRGM